VVSSKIRASYARRIQRKQHCCRSWDGWVLPQALLLPCSVRAGNPFSPFTLRFPQLLEMGRMLTAIWI